MEEKRKKFGMEMLPSLHKQLKAAALKIDLPLWALTQQAVKEWLAREFPERDENEMNDSTKTAGSRHQTGTFNQSDAPIDRKIVENVTEKSSSGSTHTEVPPGYADSARTAAAIEELKQIVAGLRASVSRVEQHLTRTEKSAKSAARARRVVPRRKRKHPPGAQSGA